METNWSRVFMAGNFIFGWRKHVRHHRLFGRRTIRRSGDAVYREWPIHSAEPRRNTYPVLRQRHCSVAKRRTMKYPLSIAASFGNRTVPDNSSVRGCRCGPGFLVNPAVPALICIFLALGTDLNAQDDDEFNIEFAAVGSGGSSAGGSEEFSLNAGVGQWEAGP